MQIDPLLEHLDLLGSIRERHCVAAPAPLSELCVYTMKRRAFLERAAQLEGGAGTIKERKKWASGERLFAEAKRNQERLPVVFSAADIDSGVIYWAILTDVDAEDGQPEFNIKPSTTFSFTGLTAISPPRRLEELTLWNEGKPRSMSPKFQRNYAICLTPSFLGGGG